jgi:hypothetical protein
MTKGKMSQRRETARPSTVNNPIAEIEIKLAAARDENERQAQLDRQQKEHKEKIERLRSPFELVIKTIRYTACIDPSQIEAACDEAAASIVEQVAIFANTLREIGYLNLVESWQPSSEAEDYVKNATLCNWTAEQVSKLLQLYRRRNETKKLADAWDHLLVFGLADPNGTPSKKDSATPPTVAAQSPPVIKLPPPPSSDRKSSVLPKLKGPFETRRLDGSTFLFYPGSPGYKLHNTTLNTAHGGRFFDDRPEVSFYSATYLTPEDTYIELKWDDNRIDPRMRGQERSLAEIAAQNQMEWRGLVTIPAGFAYLGTVHNLSGQPLRMLEALLKSQFHRVSATTLENLIAPEATGPDARQAVKDAVSELKKVLQAAMKRASYQSHNALISHSRGLDLAYELSLPEK